MVQPTGLEVMWNFSLYVMSIVLLLVNKEAISASGLAEYSKAGNLNRDIESRQNQEMPHSCRFLQIGHSIMEIHRLIEMS